MTISIRVAALSAVVLISPMLFVDSPASAEPVLTTATVLRIVDGDTIDIVDDVRGRLRVRLLGIDTPETKKPGYTIGCWGPEASEFATETLLGQRVALIPDPTQDRTDRYGRTLAYLDKADGWDYSIEAARAGGAIGSPPSARIAGMTATPLTDIHLPEQALTELRGVDVTEWIHDHAIAVGRPWWTQTLAAHGLDDTLTGETIRRADIFALADAAPDDPAAALTLLWNSLAWGSGDKRRTNKARIAAIAADPDAAAALLQQAAARSRTDPQAAYDLLYPCNRAAISDLGPAFFTAGYLYFAGGGEAAHPCCILDENVALTLQKTCGWTSLPLTGWLASAYQRYATLLGMWVDQHDLGRRDSIERWLFEEGKRGRRAGPSGAP